jgi:hypothetical protein
MLEQRNVPVLSTAYYIIPVYNMKEFKKFLPLTDIEMVNQRKMGYLWKIRKLGLPFSSYR